MSTGSLYPVEPPADAIPVTLISGFSADGAKSALLAHWLAQRPPEQGWALVVNETAPPADAGPSLTVLDLRGSCVCCAALQVLRARLPALLRGRPRRLLVELAETADPDPVLRLLAGLAWQPYLRPSRVVAAIAGRRLAAYGPPGDPARDPSLRRPPEQRHADLHLSRADAVQLVGPLTDGDLGWLVARAGSQAPRTLATGACGQWLALD